MRTRTARDALSAQCQSSRNTTSVAGLGEDREQRRERIDERGLQMLTLQVTRERVRTRGHRQEMQIQREVVFERRIDRADSFDQSLGIDDRAPFEAQRSANDLDERSVWRDVAKRAASAFQHIDTSRRRDPLVKLVQEAALADARVADDLHNAAVGPASALDVAFEQRQVGLPADIRCQAGLLRNLEPRLETGFSRHAERCDRGGGWFEHHRRARRRMNVGGEETLAFLAEDHIARGRQGRQPRRHVGQRADNGVPTRSFIQPLGDHRPDMQPGLNLDCGLPVRVRSEFAHARMQLERGTYRAQLIVVMRRRDAEQTDDFLADRLVHETAVPSCRIHGQIANLRHQAGRGGGGRSLDEAAVVRHNRHQQRRTATLGDGGLVGRGRNGRAGERIFSWTHRRRPAPAPSDPRRAPPWMRSDPPAASPALSVTPGRCRPERRDAPWR